MAMKRNGAFRKRNVAFRGATGNPSSSGYKLTKTTKHKAKPQKKVRHLSKMGKGRGPYG